MKKLLLVALLAVSGLLTAQNFPGDKVELLDGKQVKVLPKEEDAQKYGYRDFYASEAFTKNYKSKTEYTPHADLVDKVFKVVSYTPYKSLGTTKYKLKLENESIGIVYFNYDPRYSSNFPFEVIGGLTYPDGYFCSKAEEKASEPGKSREFQFAFVSGVKLNYFVKDAFEFMLFTINSPTKLQLSKDAAITGVTLTFDNGETINLPDQKVKHAPNGAGGTALTAIFGFIAGENDKEIEILKNNKITKIKLYTDERDYKDGYTIQEYVKCATSKTNSKTAAATTQTSGDYCSHAVRNKNDMFKDEEVVLDYPTLDILRLRTFKGGQFNHAEFSIKFKDEKWAKGMKGITFVLDNGKTVVFDQEVNSEYSKDIGIEASKLLALNSDEVALLKKHKIVKVKLGTLERSFKDGAKLLEYINCATK